MIRPIDLPEPDLPSRIAAAFDTGGLLARVRNFESRPEQKTMAKAVASALAEERHLMVEAGTGVGKSIAYLLPALYYAHEQQKKAVVSTHTINLQEQLLNKDIALLERLLPFKFEAALLKGRQNYICPRRLRRALQQADDLFVSSEQAELRYLADWIKTTRDGTLSELRPQPNAKVWSQVCSERHLCTAKTCGHDPLCFYQQARKRQQSADLIILNHHLLFTYLNGSESTSDVSPPTNYLFPNDFLIIDEAHCLETVATQHIGLSFTSGQIRFLIQRLYNPKTRKGLINQLRQPALEKATILLHEEADQFFSHVEHACHFQRGNEFRVTRPDFVQDTLSLPMMELRHALIEAAANLDDELARAELQDAARKLAEQRARLAKFLSQEHDGFVYWVSRQGTQQTTLNLQAAPVDLAPTLRSLLFGPGRSAILTSATFSTGPGLGYIQSRIGADEADTLQLDSPFDYARQMKVFIPKHIPAPNSPDHDSALHAWLRFFLSQSQGKAFVLFTNYTALRKAAANLAPWTAQRGYQLLVQGEGASPSTLLQTFKDDLHSILLGTDSFWQGVDVPGESLSSVIITKLPFPVPDHPLIEAKVEAIEARGGDAFLEYSLPEAILKFRQGVGRLIRTKTDTGSIVILDSRILSKPYGRLFLNNLPKCPFRIIPEPLGPDGNLTTNPPSLRRR